MSDKSRLREQRAGTVINNISKRQEQALDRAMKRVSAALLEDFPGIRLVHDSQWKLQDVVSRLSRCFPMVDFHYCFATSAMRPDGGILSMRAIDDGTYTILISEKKNQGTNDLRALEGKKKQAKGNAIERLGKNVIGFRAALKSESIFPFVCFGDGCDFAENSSILDRVITIAEFGRLNEEHLHDQADGFFDRGTFHFRVPEWTEEEMFFHCYSIAKKSVFYYFSKYGDEFFSEK
jgi:type II restriction enzyme